VLLRTGTVNEVVDYAQRERGPQAGTGAVAAGAGRSEPGFDYLDIPAFLRRQAD
jgi:cell division protein FtsZ